MKRLSLIIALLFVLGSNVYFRAFPVYFPQLKIQAKHTVEERIYQDIVKEVDREFAEFSPQAKDKLLKGRALEYKRKNKAQIKSQAQNEYLKLKDKYQDARGQTYLMELDCWHWARYVENVVQLGSAGDEVINGREVDTLMLSPLGSAIYWNKFLFYFSAFLYKGLSLIKPVPLFTFLFYLPLFFIIIFLALLYLFCCKNWGNLCAIVSCLYVGLAPIFLHRSSAGWFDTDILNLLFPLLIVWAYLMAYKNTAFKLKAAWIFFSSFWVGLFCFAWTGWWFIFLIIILYEIFSLPRLFKNHLFSLAAFLLFSCLWIVIFSGQAPLAALFNQLKEALALNKPLTYSLWPNVFSTVDELRKPGLFEITSVVGGIGLFVPGAVCVLILFLRALRRQRCTDFEREFRLILFFWFITMLFACLKGIRFAMFILVPLGVSLGWIINEAYNYFKNKKKAAMQLLALGITLLLCGESINNGYREAKTIFPLMDDAWYKLLTTLRGKASPKAIINSWWDFGDWFKAVSKRKVIFDGHSQNMPAAYWMSSALLAENEEEAIRILRMLNNGGNSAFEIINRHLKDPFKSVLLLKEAVSLDSKGAEETLINCLPVPIAKEVMKMLLDKPPQAYFVVDYTMQNKIPTISFLGNWDFTKVYLAYNINKEEKNKTIHCLKDLVADKQRVENLYQEASLISKENLDNWVSRGFKFYGGIANGQVKNNVVLFDNSLVYDFKEQGVFLYSSKDSKYKIPKSLFIFEDNNGILKEFVYPNNDLDLSALVFKDQGHYQAILLDSQLANSLFVRLYFLNGAGLKHFKPFIEEKPDGYIRAFEIIWE